MNWSHFNIKPQFRENVSPNIREIKKQIDSGVDKVDFYNII